MTEEACERDAYWRSPTRARTPLMWIIGVVALALTAMLLAPLAPLVASAAASVMVARPVNADAGAASH